MKNVQKVWHFEGFWSVFEPKTSVFDGFLRLKNGVLGLIPT
jgi:hypothetical protein